MLDKSNHDTTNSDYNILKKSGITPQLSIIIYSVAVTLVGWGINLLATKFSGTEGFNPFPGLLALWIHYDFIKQHLEAYNGNIKNIYLPSFVIPVLNLVLFFVGVKLLSLGIVLKFGNTTINTVPFMIGLILLSLIAYFITTGVAIRNYKNNYHK